MDQASPCDVPGTSPNRLLRIPPAEFQRVRQHLEHVAMTPRDFFVAAGEPLTYVYFPYSGVVSLRVGMQSGDTVEVATVGRRGMLGIAVLLEADPAPYDMVSQVAGQAGRLPAQTFVQLARELPHFRRLLLRYALWLFHEVARTAACNRLHTVEQRLARWLLHCSDEADEETYPLTHESLARMLGARRPYVSRRARTLQDSGLIRYHHGALQVLDRARLEAVSCEDYRATQQEYARLLAAAPG